MKVSQFKFLLGLIGIFAFSSASASHSGTNACQLSDVKVTQYWVQEPGTPTINNINVNATDCIGAESGNNSKFDKPKNGNLGYDEDGWLNKEDHEGWWNGHGAFVTDADLLDLDNDGQVDDPGWIRMGKEEQGTGFVPDTSDNGTLSYTYIQDLFKFQNCQNAAGQSRSCFGGEAVKGEWVYTPPAVTPAILGQLLGGDFFDQAAFVFKAGKEFAMYNFKLSALGLGNVIFGDYNYAFSGTWDISNVLGGHGLSNFELWARDPISVEVPEPGTFSLLLVSGLFLYSRHRKFKA